MCLTTGEGISRWLSSKRICLTMQEMQRAGSVSRSGRHPVNGNPLQYSCLENCLDKKACQIIRAQRVRHDLVTEHTQQDWKHSKRSGHTSHYLNNLIVRPHCLNIIDLQNIFYI